MVTGIFVDKCVHSVYTLYVMDTAVINIRIDQGTKKKAQKLAEDLGLSLSGMVTGLLKQVIKTKTVTFSVREEIPSDYMIKALKESKEDIKAGRVMSFVIMKEELEYLDKLIVDDKRRKKS